MNRNKIFGIILIIVGVVLLIIGIGFSFSTKKEEPTKSDDFMMNTTQFFDGITCYNNLCLSDLKIDNSSTKDTKVEFNLTNNNETTTKSSTLNLKFNTGDKISFTYKDLEPKEIIKIKVSSKSNLSEVMSYKLEKN